MKGLIHLINPPHKRHLGWFSANMLMRHSKDLPTMPDKGSVGSLQAVKSCSIDLDKQLTSPPRSWMLSSRSNHKAVPRRYGSRLIPAAHPRHREQHFLNQQTPCMHRWAWPALYCSYSKSVIPFKWTIWKSFILLIKSTDICLQLEFLYMSLQFLHCLSVSL